MEENEINGNGNSSSSSNGNGNINNHIPYLVLDHLFSSSSSLSSALAAAAVATSAATSHPGSVGHLAPRPVPPAGGSSAGSDPPSLVRENNRRSTPEPDGDSYDCDSEEETVKPSGQRASGWKRNRAAQIHNLSEKRRRSRINEKMKALQSLIPNSNKTDKASMLDDAIEYLKQLQLQVQMLSMQNGMSLSPAFLPGDFPALQSSEMHLRFGVDHGTLTKSGTSVLPVSQDSLIQGSVHLPNQCTSSLHSHAAYVSDIKGPMLAFTEDLLSQPSNVRPGSFNLSMNSGDTCTKGITPHPQSDARPGERQMQKLTATVSHVRRSISEVGPDDQ